MFIADKNITSLELPHTLTVIRKEAFAQNHMLSVKLPGSISRIEDGAFSDCRELREVTLDTYTKGLPARRKVEVTCRAFERTYYIGAKPFVLLDDMLLRVNVSQYKGTRFLEIPNKVHEIKAYACELANYSVEEIGIPASVKYIGDYAFARMFCLKDVLIEKGQTSVYFGVGKAAFGTLCNVWRENPFLWNLRRRAISSDSNKTSGWISFRYLRCMDNRGYSASYGSRDIYVPYAEKADFWEQVMICYFSNRDFILSLEWSEYRKLFERVESLYDKIEMAICIIQNTSSHRNETEMQFIENHINKAVKYALEKNQKERLMFYFTKHLLSAEHGFQSKKALSLIERYDNESSTYLRQILQD